MSRSQALSISTERANALQAALGERRAEIEHLLAILMPQDLALPTVCTGWSIRDEIGHLVDATEMLTRGLEQAEVGVQEGTFRPYDMAPDMKTAAINRVALLPLPQLLLTFSEAADALLQALAKRDPNSWDEPVAHPYLGTCTAVQFAGFAFLDWFIHPWDIQEALGLKPEPNPDHATLLFPGLIDLMTKRLDLKRVRGWKGRFRYLLEEQGAPDKLTDQWDVILAKNIVTVEPNVSQDVPADLTFRGQPSDMVLGMLGRRGLSRFALPAATNETWLSRWSYLWISL